MVLIAWCIDQHNNVGILGREIRLQSCGSGSRGPLGLRMTSLISCAHAETSQLPPDLQMSCAGGDQKALPLSGQGAVHCSVIFPACPCLEVGCPAGWLTASQRLCGPEVVGEEVGNCPASAPSTFKFFDCCHYVILEAAAA